MRKSACFAALLVCVVAAGCSKGENPAVSGTPTPAPSPSPPKPVLCPLTGLEAPKDVDVNRPALGVKIANSKDARPQAGLENADIVYEILAEGGISRFLAIYHCDGTESLGPIRSARSADVDVLREYEPAILAYSGGHPEVRAKVKATKQLIPALDDENPKLYTFQKGRRAPQNLFSSTTKLRTVSDRTGAPKIGLVFDHNALGAPASPSPSPARGTTAAPPPPPASPSASPAAGNAVTFAFSGTDLRRYTFDPAAGAYLRSHGDTAHNSVSGQQLRTNNVVVLKVNVTQSNYKDAAGNFSPEITVTGGGEAVVLRGGTSITGKWMRNGLSDKMRLVDAAGKDIALLPGRTWVHLVPNGQAVTVS